MNKPKFYGKLDEKGKKQYDAFEEFKPHTQKFVELMSQENPSEGAPEGMFFTEEELDYLGKEDLVTLGNLHPSEADFYMMCD